MHKYELNLKLIETQMVRQILSKHTLTSTFSRNDPQLSISLIEHTVQHVLSNSKEHIIRGLIKFFNIHCNSSGVFLR